MTRLGNTLLALVFAALIGGPAVLFAAGVRPPNVENRTLTAAPDVSLRSLAQIETYKQAAQAFEDRLPYRDRIIHERARLSLRVLGDSPAPAVIVGDDGWLFLRSEFEVVCQFRSGPAEIREAYRILRAALAATGRDLRYTVVPSKRGIEDEHYGRTLSVEACPRQREAELERLLVGAPGFVDLWGPMRAAKARGEDVWLANDTHTSMAGSLIIARALADSIDPSVWPSADIGIGPPVPRVGDLTNLMGFPSAIDAPTLRVSREPARKVEQPAVVLGDSQLVESLPAIAPFFASAVSCHLDMLGAAGVCDATTLAGAQLVVLETVVRSMYEWVENGFPRAFLTLYGPELPLEPAAWTDAAGATIAADGTVSAAGPLSLALVPPAAGDRPDDVRLLELTFPQTGPSGATVALGDAAGAPLTGPMTTAAAVASGGSTILVLPRGVPIADLRLQLTVEPGTVVAAPRLLAIPAEG